LVLIDALFGLNRHTGADHLSWKSVLRSFSFGFISFANATHKFDRIKLGRLSACLR